MSPVSLAIGSATILGQTSAARVFVNIGTAAVLSRVPADPQGVPWWGDSPASWDTVRLGGIAIPGLARVAGHAGLRVDRKCVPGQNGERLTVIGYEAAEVDVELRLWTEADLRAFEELLPLIRPKPGKKLPKAVRIVHPATTLLGIDYVQVMQVGLPSSRDGDIYEVRLKLREYVSGAKAGKGKVYNTDLLQLGPGALVSANQAAAGASLPGADVFRSSSTVAAARIQQYALATPPAPSLVSPDSTSAAARIRSYQSTPSLRPSVSEAGPQ